MPVVSSSADATRPDSGSPVSAAIPFGKRLRLALTRRTILLAAGDKVVSGPFRGMQWAHASPMPYVLGTHELELRPWIDRLVAMGPDRIVNVGAADGYFATGLALRLPAAQVIAFEMEPGAQARCLAVARANGIEARLTMHGLCTAEALAKALDGARNPVVVIDIEGGEIEVLDPGAVPALRHATILVETHDLLRDGCAATVRQRFSTSHDIESVHSRKRSPADFPREFLPWLQRAAPEYCGAFVWEERGPGQEWLLLTPRSAG
jgi:predicted O-methyltransferase YrrM